MSIFIVLLPSIVVCASIFLVVISQCCGGGGPKKSNDRIEAPPNRNNNQQTVNNINLKNVHTVKMEHDGEEHGVAVVEVTEVRQQKQFVGGGVMCCCIPCCCFNETAEEEPPLTHRLFLPFTKNKTKQQQHSLMNRAPIEYTLDVDFSKEGARGFATMTFKRSLKPNVARIKNAKIVSSPSGHLGESERSSSSVMHRSKAPQYAEANIRDNPTKSRSTMSQVKKDPTMSQSTMSQVKKDPTKSQSTMSQVGKLPMPSQSTMSQVGKLPMPSQSTMSQVGKLPMPSQSTMSQMNKNSTQSHHSTKSQQMSKATDASTSKFNALI